MKFLEETFTIDVQDQYTESYKTLLWEIKEDLNKWRIILCA